MWIWSLCFTIECCCTGVLTEVLLHNPAVARDGFQQRYVWGTEAAYFFLLVNVMCPMQSRITPHWPVAAAADIVFHARPACWQRAWHRSTSSPLPFMFLPLSHLHCTQTHRFLPPDFLPHSAWVAVCCAWEEMKTKKVPVWWHHRCHSCSANMSKTMSGNNCCECLCTQILLLLVRMRVQLQAAEQEVVLTMDWLRQENKNTHTHCHTTLTHCVPSLLIAISSTLIQSLNQWPDSTTKLIQKKKKTHTLLSTNNQSQQGCMN